MANIQQYIDQYIRSIGSKDQEKARHKSLLEKFISWEPQTLTLPQQLQAQSNLGITTGLMVDNLQFNTAATPLLNAEGLLQWNATDGTLDLGMQGGLVTQQIGQELFIKVINKTGSTITEGSAVYFNGRQGNRPKIELAKGDSESTSKVMGIVTHDIVNDAEGYITTFGYVRQIKTNYTGWTEGAILYLSSDTAGELTHIAPDAPNHSDMVGIVGIVGAAGIGSIFVSIDRHRSFTELSDVNGTPLTESGQFAVYNQITQCFDFSENINLYKQVKYNPTTLTVNTGTLIQGTVADLAAVGGTDVIIQEVTGSDPLRATLGFTGVNRLNSFNFFGRYSGGAMHVVWIEAYDYVAAAWKLVGEIGNNAAKGWFSFNLFLSERFISSGASQVRFNHQGTGINTHQLILDYVDVSWGGGGGSYNDHATLANLGWTNSNHSGTANYTPVFSATGTPALSPVQLTAAGSVNVPTGQVYQVNGMQISSADLSNNSNIVKYNDAIKTFTGTGLTSFNGGVEINSPVFPVLNLKRNITGGTGVYGAVNLELTNTTPADGHGIGYYFKAPNSLGSSSFSGFFGGALATIAAGAEVGELVFGAAWHGLTPSSNRHLVITATSEISGDVSIPNGNLSINGNTTSNTFRSSSFNTGYSLVARNGVGNSLFVQQSGQGGVSAIARFLHGSMAANTGTLIFDISSTSINSSVVISAPTAKLTTGATADYYWKCTNMDGSGAWTAINQMVYPAAGIPISTGMAWGTSITDNSTNWNTAYAWVNANGANAVTAYNWGNHANAGYWVTPTGTNGDILYYNNGWQKRAAGTDGYVLTMSSGLPVWAAVTASQWINNAAGGILYTMSSTAADVVQINYASNVAQPTNSILRLYNLKNNPTVDFFQCVSGDSYSVVSKITGAGNGYFQKIYIGSNFSSPSAQITDSGAGLFSSLYVGSVLRISSDGQFLPAELSDTAASRGSIYISVNQGKLVFKDFGGTVNVLY